MLKAVVTGNVWSTKRIEGMPHGAFLEVVDDRTGACLVAFDVLGSGLGEHVLVAQGSVAASWFPGAPPPVDALIVGSIDQPPTDETDSPSSDGPPKPPHSPHTRV